MASVPPRGSGWVRVLPIANCRFPNSKRPFVSRAIQSAIENLQCSDPPAIAGGTDLNAKLLFVQTKLETNLKS